MLPQMFADGTSSWAVPGWADDKPAGCDFHSDFSLFDPSLQAVKNKKEGFLRLTKWNFCMIDTTHSGWVLKAIMEKYGIFVASTFYDWKKLWTEVIQILIEIGS